MTTFLFIAFASVFWLSGSASAQEQKPPAPPKTELAGINSYAQAIEQFTKRNPKRKRFFGNEAGAEDKQDNWREFKDLKEFEQVALDEKAYVWRQEGRVVAAKFAFTSSSGDWFHYVTYYYRADGTLAKIHAQLNTFYSSPGGVSVVRDKFYGSNGKLLHTSTRYLDLQSQRPRKRGDFMDEPIPVYKTARALPFAKLLPAV